MGKIHSKKDDWEKKDDGAEWVPRYLTLEEFRDLQRNYNYVNSICLSLLE